MKMRSLRLRAAAALAVFTAVTASADVIVGSLKTKEGLPMAGETITFYVSAPYSLIGSQLTDAAGNFTFNDPVSEGQLRCVAVSKPGWAIATGPGSNTNPVCVNAGFGPVNFIAERPGVNGIKVIGGARGFVNPDRGETASIIVIPDSRTITTKIYTSRGKLVLTKTTTATIGLQHEIVWDGRNSDGQKVSSGIYIANVKGSGLNMTGKIAIVRN